MDEEEEEEENYGSDVLDRHEKRGQLRMSICHHDSFFFSYHFWTFLHYSFGTRLVPLSLCMYQIQLDTL